MQEPTNTEFRNCLTDIVNWCDLAISNPREFDSHGVRNLSGPAFAEARRLLGRTLPSKEPADTSLWSDIVTFIGECAANTNMVSMGAQDAASVLLDRLKRNGWSA